MFGRLKTNLANFAQKRDRSKSPATHRDQQDQLEDTLYDSGEYVTIADVRNNNEKAPRTPSELTSANDVVNKNLNTVLSGKITDTEYVSLNELPVPENNTSVANINLDSLERKRQGARVTLDAEGKVVYSSDSLRRRKGAHTTFEPGPHVKPANSPSESPLPVHRTPKSVRPVANSQIQMLAAVSPVEFNRPLSPQSGKYVIRASSSTAEIVRMPPSTIVAPTVRPMSPKSLNRGAYVHIQDTTGRPPSPTQEKGKHRPTPPTTHTLLAHTKNSFLELANRVKRSDSYRSANSPILHIFAGELEKLDIEDRIEKEIANELWLERINYPSTVSPKPCERRCHVYSRAHAQQMLLASPGRVVVPVDPGEGRARVLSASVTDTEIW